MVVRWLHRDGRIVHVEPRAILVRDGDGRPVAVEGTLRDVTARVSAEEALRESEARLRSVFAAITEGVLVFDAQGRVVDCNAAAERMLGRSRDELLGGLRTASWPTLREDGTAFLPPSSPRPNAPDRGADTERGHGAPAARRDGALDIGVLGTAPCSRARIGPMVRWRRSRT